MDNKSRKQEFFETCKVDNYYIFQHEEYDWDDIVNAFIAGGIYADSNPKYKWIRLKKENLESLIDVSRYLVYKSEYDEYYVLDGYTIKQYFEEKKYDFAKLIDYPFDF